MKSVRRPARAVRNGLPWVPIALTLVLMGPTPASGRARPGAESPQLIQPDADARLTETELTFAWTAAPGTSEHFLLISERPFDPSSWTSLPTIADVRVVRATRPVVGWSQVGIDLTADAHVWWAAADRDPVTGRLIVSGVRSTVVLRRFWNRAAPSPLVSISPVGRATPAATGPHRIHLEAGFEIDPAIGGPSVSLSLQQPATPTGGRKSFLVYYGDADPEDARRAILASGGRVVSYVPDRTFLVRTSATAEPTLGTPGAWTGVYQPAYKLSRRLAADAAARQTVSVLLFPDADLPAVADAARATGAVVQERSDNGINKILRLELTRSAVDAMALHPDVEWIEPYIMPQAWNQFAQGIVQTGVVGNRRVWNLGLKGEGQVVMTTDAGINTQHIQFRDTSVAINTFGSYPTHRKIIEYDRGSDNPAIVFGDHGSFHGTHTACTVAGNDDPLGTSLNDGMAKNAKLWFADLAGPLLGTGVAPPTDLNDLYQPGYNGNAGGAPRLCSNSWGSDVAGAYTIEAQQVDQFMWNHPDFLLFYANGNAGPGGATVGSPAVAKDCVGVGASGNNTSLNSLAGFSSRGPTQDMRRKPTIVAPGQSLTSASSGDSSYATLQGTSMACPAATGCATLIRQYLTEGWYPTGAKVPGNGFTPSAALMKAMVVNSGNNTITGTQVPDNLVGWGRIDADSVLYFSGDARRLLLVDQTSGLGNGQAIDYVVDVTDGSIPLKASLVWTDYPGNPLASIQLVNDLDLTVSNGGTTYLGNVFTGGVSVAGGSADHRNVEEGVRVASPATGLWTVHVNATNVAAGPQPFALVVTGGLGTTAGALALDRASYGSGGVVQLRVTDTNASSPVSVTIASTSEPAGEAVSLTGSNGVFTSSIPLSAFAGSAGDGVLRVSNGDQITATYVDASPAATITAKAAVVLDPPTISNVFGQGSGPGAAIVTWTTNASADSRVFYGTTPALGSATALDALAVVSHAESISNLTIGQLYYYDVESTDLQGNVTRDDNGGAHYRFTAGRPADVLLVYDGIGYEKASRYVSALAATGWSYDLWTGDLSANPRLGDSSAGMRQYRAVWWQNGIENYPPFTDAARDSIAAYLSGGGRMAVTGHDVAWANGDSLTSPFYTIDRGNWLKNTLHTQWLVDPATWSGLTGMAGDPISGAYSGGVSYTPARAGGAGDEVAGIPGAGTASNDWISGSPAPNVCGFRWVSGTPLGTPGVGVWGGSPTRLATEYFEWSTIDNASDPSAIRNDVLQKTLVWLIGRDKPQAAVTAPNGGEVLTGNSTSITWTESVPSGAGVSARTIEYSLDNGASWTTLSTAAGPSPYVWDLTNVPNTSQGRARVRVTDGGTPTLSMTDMSNAVFTIDRVGADVSGPVVMAGSIDAVPNPIDNQQPATATATVSDAGTGGAAVSQAEWSFGDAPAPAGQGHAMSGAFGTPTVAVSAALTTAGFSPGVHRLWVRGRDAVGNWGAAGSVQLVVNGPQPLAVVELPRDYALSPGAPNPAVFRSIISYSLPRRGPVDLAVYDVSGRRVRSIVRGPVEAGVHQVVWDLHDDTGGLVRAGVYYYRLAVAGRTFTRRLIALN